MLNAVRTCCGDNIPLATVEEHVASFLANLFAGNLHGDNSSQSGNNSDIRAFIKSYFVAHEDLESRLAKLASDIKLDLSQGKAGGISTSIDDVTQ